MIYSLLFPKFKNIAPVRPAASGVNCDKGPKNAVKFVPIQDIAKSTTANPIRSIPIIWNIPLSFLLLLFFSFSPLC